nr:MULTISPECIES: tripartite tricarboxylate transporter substrate binding protein [unclassified Variovorax]
MCAAALAVAQAALAQGTTFPDKPVHIIVPGPPGAATDAIARGLGEFLRPRLGQAVVVENRPGATGIIGTSYFAKSPADGYTLLLTNSDPVIMNPLLYDKLPYDAERDLVPVANLGIISGIVLAHPSVRANSMVELMELGRAKPGSVKWATFGVGSFVHVYAEWLSNSGGAGFLSVPYKGGGPALQATIAGEVDVTLFGIGPAIPLIEAGRVKPLAILGPKRSPLLPNVPTLAEQGFPQYITTWLGLFAPRGTPQDVVRKINGLVNQAMQDPAFKTSVMDPQTIDPMVGSPEDFAEFVRKDRAVVGPIVRESKVKMTMD